MSSLMTSIAEYFPAAGFVALPLVGGFISGVTYNTRITMRDWYEKLNFPWYRPPNWLFGPVWSVVYPCMGVSSYLIWREGGFEQQALSLAVYGGQLVLNMMWTPIFFGHRRIGLALIDIVALWGSIVVSIAVFYPVNRTAALLLLPHLGWVSFATLLNFSMWRLNRGSNKKSD